MTVACLWLWLGRGCCWPVPNQYAIAQVSVFSGLFGKGGWAERGRKSRSGPNGIGEQMPVGSAHEHVEKAGKCVGMDVDQGTFV
ncbi:uncharacterized protein LY79DRAFT_687745 [Colletotrichum navitas]|uniref:Secreted protein n=1 Tax=Colletotrichum navitas TaxID=681940 RepID=A0AAD8V5J0_9PEZI|nr:uncharacterized protein LY79DRAFT_687745 [Colletotrichum navitas]KAK1590283.1 hypothetical protein LY79DRAFT_687745 [Colletotrichum navitas]